MPANGRWDLIRRLKDILYSIDEKGLASTTNGRVMKLIQDLNRETKDETAWEIHK